MLLFIISMGLTVIFGVMGVLNFAHGSFYMLGAYICLALLPHLHSFWLALIVAPILVGILGVVVEVTMLRPLYGRDLSYQLLLTFGLLLIIDDGVKILWGAGYHSIDPPALLAGTVQLFGNTYPVYSLFIAGVGPVIALVFWCFFNHTTWGSQCFPPWLWGCSPPR